MKVDRGSRTEMHSIKPEDWKYCQVNGWRSTKCRRSWATAWVEQFHASEHPDGWQNTDHDDTHWPQAQSHRHEGSILLKRETPMLKEWLMPAETLIAAAEVSLDADFPEDGSIKLGEMLDNEAWKKLPLEQFQADWSSGAGIETSKRDSGLALVFDLGVNVAAQIEFQVNASCGVVDAYGAERLSNGRPLAYLKGADYACRWHAANGAAPFRTINYNGFRYLLIVLRPDGSPMRLKAAGAWRRQSDMTLHSNFSTRDAELFSLWQKSIHTLQIGTQETGVDCPTREQAFYVGDGLWHSLWLSRLFNEPSHLHHFFQAVESCQDELSGLVSPAIYRGTMPYAFLLDYCLIYVWGIDVYRRALPVDDARLRQLLSSGERVLKWFEERIGPSGIVETEPHQEASAGPQHYTQLVFIDHPGMGWHMTDEPGIARSRKSFGLNAFLIIALEAFHRCAESVGYEPQLDGDKLCIAKLRSTCRELFWNPQQQIYADCIDADDVQQGWSEHSQMLAVLSRVTSGADAYSLIGQLIEQRANPALCRGTPYMWIYYTEALYLSGHGDKVIELVRDAWSEMNNNPEVTTWWETFLGDHLDSWCHPWSAVPAWVLHNQEEQFRIVPPATQEQAQPELYVR